MLKTLLNSTLSKFGLHLTRNSRYNGSTRFKINDYQYNVVAPCANYSPWLADAEFLKIYQEIKTHTLVDIYRCYELWELTEKIWSLNPNAHFLEIGVWRGGTAAIIGRKLALLNSNINFYLADTFVGVAKTSDKDTFYNGGEHADTSQEIVERLVKNKFHGYKILKGIFPDDTSALIDDKIKFGLCHIDVDVYESSKGIVDWIWNKMIVGGVIVFDDYGFHTCDGVTKYVNEQKSKSDRMIIHNLNGHALMIKLS
ncbi:MAG: class I SAM-dependent methyltransferase [Bacteroidetes bacterium]|nr:class I SAM-dependent methyltransferase [Bacteroidota bacterium]